MRFFVILSLLSASLSAALPSHKRQQQKALSTLYARADVVNKAKGINASFEFTGYTDGRGTFVKVQVDSGLLANTSLPGPFLYHIHTNPVGEDGNCTAALGHLDPLAVSESLACDPYFPQYCQEGDLSSRHGKLNGTLDGSIDAFGYTDNYLRFFPEAFSILGRSIVIHSANKTRLACGNIISTLDGTASSDGMVATNKSSTFVTHYPKTAPSNPPQTAAPFDGDIAPNATQLNNLPFALPNNAMTLRQSLNVNVTMTSSLAYINGTQVTVKMPMQYPSNASVPFTAEQ
ncbi:hypothetical protein FRB95_007208 [Tulasnella sp. JGI-2019a]|nr:hypothetical protein FRB95_007208 [Tulasnella sp. JGI-2019a]